MEQKMEFFRSHNEYVANHVNVLSGSYRNFSGEKRLNPQNGKLINEKGKRNFCMVIDPEFVPIMEAEHVLVKYLKKRDEDDDHSIPPAYVKVNIKMDSKIPPDIYKVTSKHKQKLKESNISQLDSAYFENVDMKLSVYHADADSGTLYMNAGYFTIKLDPLAEKYEDLPEISDDEELPFD